MLLDEHHSLAWKRGHPPAELIRAWGQADAFLQTQSLAIQKGWAGKASLPHLCTDSWCKLLLEHIPLHSLCPPAQLLETHCSERWSWKALKSSLLQLHPCELKQTRPALH